MNSFIASLLKPLLTFFATWLAGRAAGVNKAENATLKEDMAHAQRIQKAAEVARASTASDPTPVDERLRKLGALRD
jgi:hypothetical protein